MVIRAARYGNRRPLRPLVRAEGTEKRLSMPVPHPKREGYYADLVWDSNKCVGVIRPKDSAHWINRVLNDGTTRLQTNELNQFFRIASTSTFVFVKVHASLNAQEQVDGGNNMQAQFCLLAFDEHDWTSIAKAWMQIEAKAVGQPQ